MNAEQRITDLEAILADYIKQNALAQQRFETESKQFREEMLAFQDEIREDTRRLKEEMIEFKNEIREDTRLLKEEMAAFKDEIREDTRLLKEEMAAFKDEIREDTRLLKEEMAAFKDEMAEFKDEMSVFGDRMSDSVKENNKQWGALANKLGTIVEDIIFPAACPVIESVFGVTVQLIGMRLFGQNGNLREEFDVVAVSEKQAFLIEVKSTPRFDYLTDFVDRKIGVFRQLFPQYASLTLIPIFASLSVPDDVIKAATKRGVFVMAFRAWEYMDILNAKELLSQP